MADIEEDIKEVVTGAVEEALEEHKEDEAPPAGLVPEHNHPRYDEAFAEVNGRLETMQTMLSEALTREPTVVEVIELPPVEEELMPEEETEIVVPEEETKEKEKETETEAKEETEPETDSRPKTLWQRFFGG